MRRRLYRDRWRILLVILILVLLRQFLIALRRFLVPFGKLLVAFRHFLVPLGELLIAFRHFLIAFGELLISLGEFLIPFRRLLVELSQFLLQLLRRKTRRLRLLRYFSRLAVFLIGLRFLRHHDAGYPGDHQRERCENSHDSSSFKAPAPSRALLPVPSGCCLPR